MAASRFLRTSANGEVKDSLTMAANNALGHYDNKKARLSMCSLT